MNRFVIEFFILSTVWGFSFVFIRESVPFLGPVILIFFRTFFGGLFLLPLIFKQKLFKVLWQNKLKLTVVGFFNSGLPFFLIAIAALTLPAGLLAVLNASTPMLTALVAFLFLRERITPYKLVGIFLGLAGVLFLMWDKKLLDGHILAYSLSILSSLGAALSYAIGAISAKKLTSNLPSLVVTAGSQFSNGVILLIPSLLLWQGRILPMYVWGDVFALAAICTSFAYILYYRIIRNLGSLAASSVTFVVPFFAVTISFFYLKESFHLSFLVGGAMILTGSMLTLGIIQAKTIQNLRLRR